MRKSLNAQVLSKTFGTRTLGFRTTKSVQYSACPKDKWLEKFTLTLAGFKVPSSRPGKVNFLTGQVTFKLKAYLSKGQGSCEVIL